MSEKVLVVPANLVIKDGYPISVEKLSEVIDSESLFIERDKAEVDPTYLQIIPYVCVRYMEEQHEEFIGDLDNHDYVFTYQRLKKGSEARLHSKFSIGIGGHINPVDAPNGVPNFDTVMNCAMRELQEEIDIGEELESVSLSIGSNTPIYDPSNDVGKVHLGIMFTYESNSKNITARETEKISGSLISITDLKNRLNKSKDDFEVWSQIALEYIY